MVHGLIQFFQIVTHSLYNAKKSGLLMSPLISSKEMFKYWEVVKFTMAIQVFQNSYFAQIYHFIKMYHLYLSKLKIHQNKYYNLCSLN